MARPHSSAAMIRRRVLTGSRYRRVTGRPSGEDGDAEKLDAKIDELLST